MTEKDLLDLKEEIKTVETKVSELKGQQQMLMKQLKETYGCDTIEEAEKKLKTMLKKILIIQNKIEKGTKEVEEKYGS